MSPSLVVCIVGSVTMLCVLVLQGSLSIRLEVLRKSTNILSQDSRCPSRDSDQARHKYKSESLSLRPALSVEFPWQEFITMEIFIDICVAFQQQILRRRWYAIRAVLRIRLHRFVEASVRCHSLSFQAASGLCLLWESPEFLCWKMVV
jgi:hypothetical protein